MIHSTAIIHSTARLAADVTVGPYAVIDEHVELGPGCVVGPQVFLTGLLRAGARNRFHAGCVIGDAPQDLKYKGEATGLRIGDDNTFREHVTVHRSAKAGQETILGSGNYLMACSHVGHNCVIGNQVIVANGALLGGHVIVEDRAFISGTSLVHQFTRVGMLAMMQGGAGVSKDLPPYTIATGTNQICGLNIVGLRRAGLSPEERLELKKVYFTLFRSGRRMKDAVAAAREQFHSEPARVMIDFVANSTRGVCPDVRSGGESPRDPIELDS